MSRILVSIILVASALSVAVPPAAATTTHVVCTDAAACSYTTIQSAVNAAAAGDTIVVRPGTYFGAVNLDKTLVLCSTSSETGTSCAPDANSVTIDGAGSIYPVFITADNVLLQGFTIQNPTFTATDQSTSARVDPSLVVVYGADNARIHLNILQFPASPLAPASSRWITDGVNVAADQVPNPDDRSDNVDIAGNIFRHFVEGVGPDGTCLNAPCRMAAIDLWGAGLAPKIRLNNMLLPPGRLDHTSPQVVGIWGNAANAAVTDNFIQTTGDVIAGFYGIKGTYTNSLFEENSLYGNLHGIFVAGSGLTIKDNTFHQNSEGLRVTARASTITSNNFSFNAVGFRIAAPNGAPEATGLVLRENAFDGNTRALTVHAQVTGVTIDARENDWGVYTRDQIELFLDDAGTGNTLDISCFIDEDGVTRVCPTASFTKTVSSTRWPRTVTLVDTSTFSGSEFESRAWSLPGGATSSAATVILSLAPGAYGFGLTVEDAEGFTSQASQSLVLANTAPVFDLAATYSAVEAALLSIPLGGTDANGDTLLYTILSGPAGGVVTNGVYKWTPGYGSAGSHTVEIRADDGNLATTDTTTITVSDVPVAAVFDAVADLSVLELASASRNVRAVSPSGAPIVLSATGLPAGATFTDNGNGQGTVAITAPAGSSGVYPVVISAVSEGLTSTKAFTIRVNFAVSLTHAADSITTLKGSPGEVMTFTTRVTNTGSGDDAMTFTAISPGGWAVATAADLLIVAGGSEVVAWAVTIPNVGDVASITLRACSSVSPTVCKDVKVRVEVPIVVSLDNEAIFGVLDEINGTVTVKYLDGSLANDVSVRVTERSAQNLFLLTSSDEGHTAAGAYDFVLGDPVASWPGAHSLHVLAQRGSLTSQTTGTYTVKVV